MVGDYNLPNLKLPEQTEVTLGRWSQMRRTYLKEHHKILYYNLLTKGILNSHLAEVQQRASELEETLVKQMAQKAGLTEQMKAEDMMKWVRLIDKTSLSKNYSCPLEDSYNITKQLGYSLHGLWILDGVVYRLLTRQFKPKQYTIVYI